MILSNIDESKVGFNLVDNCGELGWYTKNSPNKEFFVQTWQKASCLEDVLDTFKHYVATEGLASYPSTTILPLSIENFGPLKTRAICYRKKGIPLKQLESNPSRWAHPQPMTEWDRLAEYARELLEE
tara:strand:+ start:491 stop:871 length:381 start_codon:yes stop_codon:yes gene_type:complete